MSRLPDGTRPTPAAVSRLHTVDVKQRPSWIEHNMNADIFKWGNMGMTFLVVVVPEDASMVRFGRRVGRESRANSHSFI